MRFLLIACSAFVLACGAPADAAAYPSKPVRIVNPYAPGGAVDTVARAIAQQLSETWRQPVIVDNRPGAGTTLGTELVVRAPADGYTLLLTSGTVGANVSLYPALSWHPAKDLASVAMLVQSPYILAVHPSTQVSSVADFIKLARGRPGHIVYGSVGTGSSAHLTMELFKTLTKTDMLHVPYKGGAPSVAALLSGEIQAIFSPVQSIVPLARSGKVRALGVSSANRVELAPELPTVAESGVPGFESIGWYPMFAPAKTPESTIMQINADVNRILQKPDVRKHFLTIGMVPSPGTPESLHAYLQTDVARWSGVIKAAGVKPE